MHSQSHPRPNKLIDESSPYLLQHAHNPVDWYPWGEAALTKARTEDKPIIVSIGYSACHWCHVMERECFEKEELAELMNAHFVCIKVDREERPDVDAIYMDAIQTMGIQGGWPLNVFLMPDTKPFYGGTYFPPKQWKQVLLNVAEAYKNHKDQLAESAEQFAEGIAVPDSKKYNLQPEEATFTLLELKAAFTKLAEKFDREKGGMNKAPKFPMPSIYQFLLRYYHATGDEEALRHLTLTLEEMAFGGIYDQIGGGFARYSVDADWFAPHFEKMLYDNGQLVSLYSEAYTASNNALYREVVYQTIEFIEREMTSGEGGFYSALDADSEGEEGRFYVWTYAEWQAALSRFSFPEGFSAEMFTQYYHVTEAGDWEHGRNILNRSMPEVVFTRTHNLDLSQFRKVHQQLREHLLNIRASRVRPGLDDKILCSWNGLMLRGLVDAYRAFGEQKFLDLARRNAQFLQEKMRRGEQLFHSYKNGKASITGYLEDYAFVIDAYTALYQVTFDEQWLLEAHTLTNYAINNFYDEHEQLFFFTDLNDEPLIARKKELFDNVIPASNSAMAKNLYYLGLVLDQLNYTELADQMVARIKKLVLIEAQYLSNWATLCAAKVQPTAEIAIIGEESETFRRELDTFFYPNKVVAGAKETSQLPLLQDRIALDGQTTVYVCFNRACQLPVHSVEEAIMQLQDAKQE
jgi:uncharacterized protein